MHPPCLGQIGLGASPANGSGAGEAGLGAGRARTSLPGGNGLCSVGRKYKGPTDGGAHPGPIPIRDRSQYSQKTKVPWVRGTGPTPEGFNEAGLLLGPCKWRSLSPSSWRGRSWM